MPCACPELVEPVGFAVSCAWIGCGPEACAIFGRQVFEEQVEDLGERGCCARSDLVEGDLPAQLGRDRGERGLGQAARRDPLRERRRVQVDVERVAVRRHPLRDVHADRGDLPRIRRSVDPDAGQSFDSRRLDFDGGERADQRLFEVPAVTLDVLPVAGQVEDRVADELPGPVVRGLAAAVCLEDLDLGAVGDVELALLGSPPQRDHRGMLEEQDRVRDRALRDGGRERALQVPGLAVRDLPQVQHVRPSGHALSLLGGGQVARALEILPAHQDLSGAEGRCGRIRHARREIGSLLNRVDPFGPQEGDDRLGGELVRDDRQPDELRAAAHDPSLASLSGFPRSP